MTVRSKPLAGGALNTNTDTLVYTVPAGLTAIVRSLTLVNRNAAAKNFRVWHLTALGSTLYWLGTTSIASEGQLTMDSWRVLGPGDKLYAFDSGASGSIAVYGAELDGVAP